MEYDKQQIGEGADDYGRAVSQAAKAAKSFGRETAKQSAVKGAEIASNSAFRLAVGGSKTTAEIAAGSAAGGPWGAIVSSLWAARHTLFKVLVCLCLALVFLIVIVTELPSIIINKALGLNGNKTSDSVITIYEDVTEEITKSIRLGYDTSMERVKSMISDGGYDKELSMNALVNYAQSSAGYDAAYIMSAYSASVEQMKTDKQDMVTKLASVAGEMFPVTVVEREKEIITPVVYYTYEPTTVTVITEVVQTGTVNGVPQYRYESEEMIYYVRKSEQFSEAEIEVETYTEVTVNCPIFFDGVITGIEPVTYYQVSGKERLSPSVETVNYLECTIHPFDESVIIDAFGLDLRAKYHGLGITYGDVIENKAKALKKTLYGAAQSGSSVPLTDAELTAFLGRQNCSSMRKEMVRNGLSLVGKVPYFWGGKSDAGWNEDWNTPKLVTAAGDITSGTIRPFGLDCSGFTDWVYKTTLSMEIGEGTWNQHDNSYPITEEELLPGDLGFLMDAEGEDLNHVLIFAGYSEEGERMWVHCTEGTGVILNHPEDELVLSFRRVNGIEDEDLAGYTGG